MTNDTNQLDEPLHWGAAFFGWICPGLGQIMLGHHQRGFLAMTGVLGLFLCGIKLEGEEYKKFGELVAWRVTLWDGDKQVGEQKSFLW